MQRKNQSPTDDPLVCGTHRSLRTGSRHELEQSREPCLSAELRLFLGLSEDSGGEVVVLSAHAVTPHYDRVNENVKRRMGVRVDFQ